MLRRMAVCGCFVRMGLGVQWPQSALGEVVCSAMWISSTTVGKWGQYKSSEMILHHTAVASAMQPARVATIASAGSKDGDSHQGRIHTRGTLEKARRDSSNPIRGTFPGTAS